MLDLHKTFAAAALMAAGVLALQPQAASAESVLRIAMTAGDIPDWTGQPDQGFEGYRFVGFALYDGLVNWDLSRSDREAHIKPALATKWSADPGDLKKWIIELRHDVKFHDGCDWNADAAVWNFERLTSKASPAFSPLHFARARSRSNDIDRVEKIDAYTIAIHTNAIVSLFPYNLPFLLMMSPCAMAQAGNDYQAYAKAPAGTGPYKFHNVGPHQPLHPGNNSNFLGRRPAPKHDHVVPLPVPQASPPGPSLVSRH